MSPLFLFILLGLTYCSPDQRLDEQLLAKNEQTYKQFEAQIKDMNEDQTIAILQRLVQESRDELDKWNHKTHKKIGKVHEKVKQIQKLEIQNIFNISQYTEGINIKQQMFFIMVGMVIGLGGVVVVYRLMAVMHRLKQAKVVEV